MPSYGNLWREAMKEKASAQYSARTIDDAAERGFWHGFIPENGQMPLDDYAEPIRSTLSKLLKEHPADSILEIGPGWGNYTYLLAQACAHMTCVDISPDVLAYISRTCLAKGMRVETVPVKWEDYNGPKHDLVFAFNCFYRMMDLEGALQKIHETGSMYHIIGMTSGPEQEYFPLLERELGLSINYHRLDYIYILNALYQLGLDVNVTIVKLQKKYSFESFSVAMDHVCSRILSPEYDRQAVESLAGSYFTREQDGAYSYTHHFNAALLHW